MSGEKFCLRWNDFENSISHSFRELWAEKDFCDVTLACENNQVQAHKVILSACSPFFRSVLKQNPHQNPLLYLKGISYDDILAILNFMYHGEVDVAQESLTNFLAVAEDLKIKGLTQCDKEPLKDIATFPTKRSLDQDPMPSTQIKLQITSDSSRSDILNININENIKQEAIDDDCDAYDPADEKTADYSIENVHDYNQEYLEHGNDGAVDDNPVYSQSNAHARNDFPGTMLAPAHSLDRQMHSCEICYKQFSNKNSMMNHVKIHEGPNCTMTSVPQSGVISRTKALAMGLAQEDLVGLRSWTGKKRGQEGIFFVEEEIRELVTRKKASLSVELDSFSEKDITKSVPAKLRLGFPTLFRHLAQYGRKSGMRGKPTYFYSKELVDEMWPDAVRGAGLKPVRENEMEPEEPLPAHVMLDPLDQQEVHEQGRNSQKTLEDVVMEEFKASSNNGSWEDSSWN